MTNTTYSPRPDNETERLAAVARYDILDSAPELAYDEITELAAEICGCPAAFISMIDDDRMWLKSRYGLPPEPSEIPRDMVICSTTICQNDLLIVDDLTKDERFSNLPIVTGEPHLRFYCGMPLITREGYALGTICAVDLKPRELETSRYEALRRLSHQVIAQLELRRALLEMDKTVKELARAQKLVEAEKAKSDHLLLNILPTKIAQELKENDRVEPRFYGSVSIMFTDFCGFTKHTEEMEPKGLVELLDQYFSAFDEIVSRHHVEKLKTIGDAYMCVAGAPEENRGHPIQACLAALEIQAYTTRANKQREKLLMAPWELRLGIHTGPAMAGVVGKHKFTYDIWGDAVNTAALLEQAGEPGRVNISESTWHHVKEMFDVEARGTVASGKKGDMPMYFLIGLKPEYSEDSAGQTPNEAFHSKFGHLMNVYGA